MKPYYSDDAVTLYHGDCLDVIATLPAASVDAVVTDPPYDLTAGKKGGTGAASVNLDSPYGRSRIGTGNGSGGFMGKAWDSTGIAFDPATWALVLRVLKPGGHLLAFGGTRTAHRLACAIEDAGFELRDSIAWLYGSGFPKSRNLDGDWQGWGTALKPAHEPIVVARKPLAGTVAGNVLSHGTGALNIDACRTNPGITVGGGGNGAANVGGIMGPKTGARPLVEAHDAGRWPTNVALDTDTADALDRETGVTRSRVGAPRSGPNGTGWGMTATGAEYDDEGGASRFFPTFRYEAKAPTDERPRVGAIAHPTVKPLDLMRWLVRLVTPPGGVVLEPFAGSGTTAEACVVEGFRCIAIEREADYLPLIVARLTKPIEPVLFGGAA